MQEEFWSARAASFDGCGGFFMGMPGSDDEFSLP
jgi:hypothetical protein